MNVLLIVCVAGAILYPVYFLLVVRWRSKREEERNRKNAVEDDTDAEDIK